MLNGNLPEVQSAHFDLCEGCIMKGATETYFPDHSRKLRSWRLRVCAHSYVGTLIGSIIKGSRYYVAFIVDFNRKMYVYFLKRKSKVFQTVKWKVMVEIELDLKLLRCLRSDNGVECLNGRFKEYCTTNEIKIETIIYGIPQ